jgi:CheY-like chemotaxis protein
MRLVPLLVLVADDDIDNNAFFKDALLEIPLFTKLSVVFDGEQLMSKLLQNLENLPDIIFLDISMPRKTGIECLAEMQEHLLLEKIHTVIFSTAFPYDELYEDKLKQVLLNMGAFEFIRKPSDFEQLKKIIHASLNSLQTKRLSLK